jgi:hypothetical protein
MAAKRRAAKSKSKSKAKTKPTARVDRLALRLLPGLPTLTEVRRRAYTASFSAEQCLEWGSKTKATQVLADAEKAVGAVASAVKQGLDGYSRERLAWVCTQMAMLQDAIARQAGHSGGAVTSRYAAVSIASRIRTKLAHGLLDAASGHQDLITEIHNRNETEASSSTLETSITGLLQLAMRLRHVPEGEVLADDAGLTEAFLSSASSMLDTLRASNDAVYGTGSGADSDETNAVEGRVLRELAHLREVLARAQARGVVVPSFPALATLKQVSGSTHQSATTRS